MKLLRQFGIIMLICYLGDFLQKSFSLPLPGSVIGMIILFALLYFKIISLDKIKEISDFLMEHLAFFFVPAGVGLMAYIQALKQNFISILGIAVFTTVIVASVTGVTIQFMKRKVKK